MGLEHMAILSAINREPDPQYDLNHLQESAAGDELLEELCRDIGPSVDQYLNRVLAYYRITPDTTNKDVERIDEARRITHNALCDRLRILARAAKAAGRPTAWWDGDGGLRDDRQIIARWAKKIGVNRMLEQII